MLEIVTTIRNPAGFDEEGHYGPIANRDTAEEMLVELAARDDIISARVILYEPPPTTSWPNVTAHSPNGMAFEVR